MFTLIIARNRACPTACSPNGIDLINENYARGVLACLLKQITHTAGSHSDEEFDKVGRARTEVEQQEQGQRVQEQSQRRLPPGRLHNLRIDLDPLFLEQGQ